MPTEPSRDDLRTPPHRRMIHTGTTGIYRRGTRYVASTHHRGHETKSTHDTKDRVREALARAEAGELDAFEVDDLIHHYTCAARELWKTCAMAPSNVEAVAWMLDDMAARGEVSDWWAAGAPRRGRR